MIFTATHTVRDSMLERIRDCMKTISLAELETAV